MTLFRSENPDERVYNATKGLRIQFQAGEYRTDNPAEIRFLRKRGYQEDAVADITRDELYEQAKDLDVPGRSQMTKDELADAIDEAEQED